MDKNKPQKKKERLEITELFMATCGKGNFEECYYGVIRRDRDKNGKEISVNSNIYLPEEGMVWAQAENQDKLGELLDELVELHLVTGIHDDPGVFSSIAETRFFHN
ncbi:MAG TPA: hypothetical protein PLV06_06120 [Bacteroidales bacterium]|nr:hypothetical protein [Bacteroidales bacterium]HPJ58794.1 hypothetical protein [Bacteroidales bacterium]HPR11944.1 hypothetical protein [Bacteroidales bacterium]HRW85764.1 hypothetical protein [Bacteroidales bacterium]